LSSGSGRENVEGLLDETLLDWTNEAFEGAPEYGLGGVTNLAIAASQAHPIKPSGW